MSRVSVRNLERARTSLLLFTNISVTDMTEELKRTDVAAARGACLRVVRRLRGGSMSLIVEALSKLWVG